MSVLSKREKRFSEREKEFSSAMKVFSHSDRDEICSLHEDVCGRVLYSIVWGTIKYKKYFVARKVFPSFSSAWKIYEKTLTLFISLCLGFDSIICYILAILRAWWKFTFTHFNLVSNSIFDYSAKVLFKDSSRIFKEIS